MSRILRTVCCLLLATLILTTLATTGAAKAETYTLSLATGEAPALSARAALLMEGRTGLVLCEKNADERLPMASTTKLMTALLALEHLSPEMTLTVPREAVGIEGSSIYLFEGEHITVQTLLYALLLSSANDAAVALAIAVSGSVEAFATLMNERAAALGLTDTHFCNPHGLHDDMHYTTARDLARLFAAALANPALAEITGTARYEAPQAGTGATRLFLNHNRLLRTLPGACGGKTGYTRAAGRCLASAALREGLLLIAVTLNAPDDWQDHSAMMEWGFQRFEQFEPNVMPLRVPVVGGTQDSVTLLPTAALSLTLEKGHGEILCSVEHPRFLFGGFAPGEVRGRLVYRLDGEVIGEIPLATAEGVDAEQPLGFFAQLMKKIRFRKS